MARAADSPRLEINTDITAQKERRERCAKRRNVTGGLSMEDFTGTLIMRTDGQIVTCNPAVASIFGFDSIEETASREISSPSFATARTGSICSRWCGSTAWSIATSWR